MTFWQLRLFLLLVHYNSFDMLSILFQLKLISFRILLSHMCILNGETKQKKKQNNIVPVSVGCNFTHTHMHWCDRTSNPLICGFRFFAVKSSEIENQSVITEQMNFRNCHLHLLFSCVNVKTTWTDSNLRQKVLKITIRVASIFSSLRFPYCCWYFWSRQKEISFTTELSS